MVPLLLQQGEDVIWKNHSPNAAASARPIFLLCAGESEDCVKHLVVKESDEGRKQLAEETLITTDDKRAYKVKHVIRRHERFEIEEGLVRVRRGRLPFV